MILKIVFAILLILYMVASGVTILVVLVQSGRGGGLSGLVGAGTSLGDQLGATGAEKALNRWTSYCAVGFLVLTILLVLVAQHIYAPSVLRDVPEVPTAEQQALQAQAATEVPAAPAVPVAAESAAPAAPEAPVSVPAVESAAPAVPEASAPAPAVEVPAPTE